MTRENEYIRECRRELLKRERQAVLEVSGGKSTNWFDFIQRLERMLADLGSPVRQTSFMRQLHAKMNAVAGDIRSHIAIFGEVGKRHSTLGITTAGAGTHPLTHEPSCLVARHTMFQVKRNSMGVSPNIVTAAIGHHALLRMEERMEECFAPREIPVLLAHLGLIAFAVNRFRPEVRDRDHAFVLCIGDVALAGAFRRVVTSGRDRSYEHTFIDIRTALTDRMLTAREMELGIVLMQALLALFAGPEGEVVRLIQGMPLFRARADQIGQIEKRELLV